MAQSDQGGELLWDPGILRHAAKLVRFIRQADDPTEFLRRLADGDIDEAFDLIDKSNETLHAEVSELRVEAEDLAFRHRDIFGRRDETDGE